MFDIFGMTESHHSPAPGQHHADTGHASDTRDARTKLVANMLTIVGLVILIVIVVWGLLHLARLSSSWFSGWFSSSESGVVVTAPAEAPAGTPFPISWSYDATEPGAFALIYKCEDGLQLSAPTASGVFQSVPCGASYTLGTSTKTVVLPTTAGTEPIEAAISILYIPVQSAGGAPAQGSARVRITAAARTQEPETPASSPSSKPQQENGVADLSVRVLAVGVIDASGAFVARQPMNQYEMAAVQFDIANYGSGTSGSYTFTAQLPTSQPYTYASPMQEPLSAGSHVVNTLRFTQAVSGTFMVTVNGGDASYGNNSASQFISVPYQIQNPTAAYPYISPTYTPYYYGY